MENIVDLLIILFFVISFLVSAFKKKKKPAQKVEPVKRTVPPVTLNQNTQPVEAKEQKKAVSPFEEILKSIIQVPEPVEEQKSEVDAYFEEAMRKSQQMESKESKRAPLVQSQVKDTIQTKGESVSYTESIERIKRQHSNLKAKKIKDSLLNKSNIKDYMIVNEILGKPIALKD